MDKLTDLYFAVYENGKSTCAQTWETLSKSGKVMMYVKKIHHIYDTGMNHYHKAEYVILNSNGQPEPYTIGSFEVVKIHKEPDLAKCDDKRIDILDHRTNKLYDYTLRRSDAWDSVENFYIEFISFMQHLYELGSWRAYEQSLEVIRKSETIVRLEQRVENLKTEIDSLKK